jgi:hypothetical protein
VVFLLVSFFSNFVLHRFITPELEHTDDAHLSMPPPPPAQSPEMLRAAAAAAVAAVGLA